MGDFNLQRISGSPLEMLYLRYDLSDLKTNPDYNEAKIHWEKDINEDTIDPERLEEQINLLRNEINEFFEKQTPEYVKRLEWKPFSLSDTDGIPSLNHVSLAGIISKLQTDWIYSQTSDNYDEPQKYYFIEEKFSQTIHQH